MFKRVAAIAVFVLGSSFLVYIGLTHTEVGRDYLRQEIESRFAEVYTGRIAIGTISGNLRQMIRLQSVSLYDEQDRIWLHVDEIIVRPNWQGIFGRKFNLHTFHIIRPALQLHYRADRTWNLSSVLTRRKTARASNWEFEYAKFSVSEGTMTISYEEHAPAAITSGWLFDLAEVPLSDISLEGEIGMKANQRLLTILSMEASLDTLDFQADGELLLSREQLQIHALNLSSTANRVSLNGVLALTTGAADFTLSQAYLTPGFVQAIAPKVLLPDSLSLNLKARRDSVQWSLQNIVAFSDRSRIKIPASTIQVRENNISFTASVDPSVIDPADLSAAVDLRAWNGGTIQVEGILEGQSAPNNLEIEGDLRLATETGSRGHLWGTAQRQTYWNYDMELSASKVNPFELTGNETLRGLISGHLAIEGTRIQSPSLSVSLALSSSMIGERSLDSLWAEGTLQGNVLDLNGFVTEQASLLSAEITADWTSGILSYESEGALSRFDLGPLLRTPDLKTDLHATWKLFGRGTRLDDLSASLKIDTDSSSISWQNLSRSTPPTTWYFLVHDSTTTGPRMIVRGDMVDLEVSGRFDEHSLYQAQTIWLTTFAETVKRHLSHQRTDPSSTAAEIGIANSSSPEEMEEGQSTKNSPFRPVELHLVWKLHMHPATDTFMAILPAFSSQAQGTADLLASPDTFRLQSRLQDNHFVFGDFSAYQAEATLALTANLSQEIESDWDIHLNVSADSLTEHRFTIQKPEISMQQDGRIGTIDIYTGGERFPPRGYLSSGVELLSDRVQIQIHDLRIPIGDTIWKTPQRTNIDLYSNATVIAPLRLETTSPFLDQIQTVTIQGDLSPLPSDTLRLNLDGVDLNHLSSILELRRPFGGEIDADLSWTGLWMPEITGTLDVDTLTFDNRLVGHLQASSILLPGGSDLRIAMIIDSLNTAPMGHLYASNQMAVTGNFIVPGSNSPGALDIFMDVEHLDASFLQLILRQFADFRGGFHGNVTLKGPLDDLILGGALDWEDGHFGIPRFNSSYLTTASVSLQNDKILINQLNVEDPYGGTATLAGTLDLNDFQFLSFDAAADLDSLQIMDVQTHTSNLAFYGDIRISGDATLTGPIHTSFLRSDNLVVSPQSEIYIPIRESGTAHDPGFIVYVDPTRPVEGQLTSFRQRENILDVRPEGERLFRDGLDMDLNLAGPPGSSIHLVVDPLLGDVINGIGTARVQIQRTGGDVATYGSFEISSGDYLFTAGEVFVRRFLIDSGTITWNGDPLNPALDIQGAYRTRASRSGLPEDVGGTIQTSLPVIVNLDVSGSLNAVLIDLALEVDQRQEAISDTPLLDSYLNRPDLAAEHATSVLLTNSFLLSANGTRSGILTSSAVNSVSSLVVSQLNRYLSQVIPQADFRLGVQSDETVQDLDVSADIAFRLLDERLLIRGQGVYRGLNTEEVTPQGLEGEFIVQIQLSPSVAVEFFYRREGDVLSESLINRETGLGLNYRTEFTSWRRLLRRDVSGGEENVESEKGS